MNQHFNFKRFNLLVLKHWAENRKRYVLSVMAFVGLLSIWFVFTMVVADSEGPMSIDIQKPTFFLSLFALGTVYASQHFSDFGSRTRAANLLLIPASSLEKFLCSLLYTALLFPIVFITTYYLIDILMITIAKTFFVAGDAAEKVSVLNVFKVDFFRFNSNLTLNFLLLFLSIQSAFLFGSVYFKKYNFIKTVISGFVVWISGAVLFYLLRHLLLRNAPGSVEMPDSTGMLFISLTYIAPPLLWIMTYQHLKSKQV
jgi:hypothetical protein